MIRRPPRSTRTDTLFPYTTLFRSCPDPCYGGRIAFRQGCSSHGPGSAPERLRLPAHHRRQCQPLEEGVPPCVSAVRDRPAPRPPARRDKGCCIPQASTGRSEEHTSELQSLMRISYAVFCLKNKKNHINNHEQVNDEL